MNRLFKAIILTTYLIISFGTNVYSQIIGKWRTSDINFFNNPQDAPPVDSATLTFRRNGHYRVDLYSFSVFPFHEQPWKKYFYGRWMAAHHCDSLLFYKNIEHWSFRKPRQDFTFRIKQVDANEIILEGYGIEMIDHEVEFSGVQVAFERTPSFTMRLRSIK